MSDTSARLSPLAQLQRILADLEFPAYLMEANEAMPFEQLLVSLDPPEKESATYVMQMMFSEALLPTTDQNTWTLQYFMELPMVWTSDRLLDTYRLVSAYNKLMPLGTLNMTEQGDRPGLFFHYAQVTEAQALSLPAVVDILTTAQFFLPLFVPKIQAFQREEVDLATLLAMTEAEWAESLAV